MKMREFEEKTQNGILKQAKRRISRVNGSGADGTGLAPTSGRFPVVVSGQIDVFQAKGREMRKVNRCRMAPLLAYVIHGALQVHGVPCLNVL